IDHVDPGTVVVREVRHIPIDFVVSVECVELGHLPFVDHVQIGPPDGRNPPCIAAGDSIPVSIVGAFPNLCYHLDRVEVLPDDSMSPEPHAPRVRLDVHDEECPGVACPDMPTRFNASVMLPPLPAFAYQLPIEV